MHSRPHPVIPMTKLAPLWLLACVPLAQAAGPHGYPVTLNADPLVMRLSKDEFRIAFGLNGGQCAASGCHGEIQYRVQWRTEDGLTHSEVKRVHYVIPPRYARSITVDRQYFDTAEAQHTTEIVKVSVDAITCHAGMAAQAL